LYSGLGYNYVPVASFIRTSSGGLVIWANARWSIAVMGQRLNIVLGCQLCSLMLSTVRN